MRQKHVQGAAELRRIVYGYIGDVQSGKRTVGKLERQCVERHLADLERQWDGRKPPRDGQIGFDEDAALHVLRFAVTCVCHTKGEWAGQPFRFDRKSAWIAFILWALFGWQRYQREDRAWLRRYRSAYISIARKNGKTMIAAIIAVYMLAFAGEPSAEVYFFATKRDQAKIGWKQARNIVKRSPSRKLRRLIQIVDSRANMNVPEDDSVCEALGRDVDTLDGWNPFLGIGDELHAQKTREGWDVIESGMGSRREPMMVGITTSGSKRQGLCWDLDHDAQRILDPAHPMQDDATFAFIARLDDGDDWADESKWPKANPNLGVSVKRSTLRDACRKAKNNVAYLNEYRRKRCNQWTEADTAWMRFDKWAACGGAIGTPEELAGEPCWAAIDVSSTEDVTALVLVFPRPDGTFHVLPYFWIPEDTVLERVQSDRVPFNIWVERGLVETTTGAAIDQDAIKQKLLDLRDRFDVREVPMDPYNGWKLATELEQLGFATVQFRQGFLSMSPAMKETERLILKEQLVHGGNEVLSWMFSNTSVKTDATANIKPDKERSADRIDGIVAMIMAVGRAVLQTGGASEVWTMEAEEDTA